MIIVEGITELNRRTANKTNKRFDLAESSNIEINYSDGHQIDCIYLNAALAEQEFWGPVNGND